MGQNARQLRSLRVRGPFRGPSGYDHHVREFVQELVAQGVSVQLEDVPEWGPATLPDELRDPWLETLQDDVGARTLLHFTMPHQVEVDRRFLNVNFTMFEASRVPEMWIRHGREHDLLIVPTDSSFRGWVESGAQAEQIRICPLGINPLRFDGQVPPLEFNTVDGRSIGSYRARFLNVSEIGPRKNLAGLVRAWIAATRSDDDAILLLKMGTHVPGWWELFQHQLAEIEVTTGKRLEEAAPIRTITEYFSDDEMPGLYTMATHYISLSYGEGWDQPMVEAAATGLRLIAPDHSAYRAYLDEGVATLIPSREVPVQFEGDPDLRALFAGAGWWEPDFDAAVEAIRRAIRGDDTSGELARERVLSRFTWQQATTRLIRILSDLEQRKMTRWRRLLDWARARN